MREHNAKMAGVHENTYYFSFVGDGVPSAAPIFGGGRRGLVGRAFKRSFYTLLSVFVDRMRWSPDQLYKGFEPEEWTNRGDNVCSSYTQEFPRLPVEAPHIHLQSDAADDVSVDEIVAGVWRVKHLPVDHLGVVPFPDDGGKTQRDFFESHFAVLAELDRKESRGSDALLTACSVDSSSPMLHAAAEKT